MTAAPMKQSHKGLADSLLQKLQTPLVDVPALQLRSVRLHSFDDAWTAAESADTKMESWYYQLIAGIMHHIHLGGMVSAR